MKRKLSFFLILVLIFSVFTLCVYADDTETEPEPESDSALTDLQARALAWIDADLPDPVINYTFDSVRTSGIRLEPYIDILTNTFGFEIVPDLDIGVCIYDDPDTAEIDGIRVNGQTVTSLKYPLEGKPTEISIAVRLVYRDGVVGDIARISDGTYDWTNLLANPLVLVGSLYYILLIAIVLVNAISSLRSKKKKAKTEQDIATSVDERVNEGVAQLRDFVIKVLDEQLSPVLKTSSDSTQRILKALVISNSKSKDAPVAILDTLQEACNSGDVSLLIENAKKSVLEAGETVLARRKEVIDTLSQIAEDERYREVNENAKQAVQNIAALGAETKSVF